MIHPKSVKIGDTIQNKKRATYRVISNDNGHITAIKTVTISEHDYQSWDMSMRITGMVDEKGQVFERDILK